VGMTQVSAFTADSLANHAVCMAAGVRDGLRTTQFYARDLANADGKMTRETQDAPWLSRVVSKGARATDRFMTWGARQLLALLLPSWRNLPSPFDARVIDEVTHAISKSSFTQNPRFNAYYFRAANHILERYTTGPSLVLEHRVDAARRALAADATAETDLSRFLAKAMIALVRHGAIARTGAAKAHHQFFASAEPNTAVFATASVALLFASEGKPSEAMDEDSFFEVTGALIGPRLPVLADLIAKADVSALASELVAMKGMY
jgi:hypothetical protein